MDVHVDKSGRDDLAVQVTFLRPLLCREVWADFFNDAVDDADIVHGISSGCGIDYSAFSEKEIHSLSIVVA
jgi:hypothetical protein